MSWFVTSRSSNVRLSDRPTRALSVTKAEVFDFGDGSRAMGRERGRVMTSNGSFVTACARDVINTSAR